MPRTTPAITALVFAAVSTAIIFFTTVTDIATGDDGLPGHANGILLAVAALAWILFATTITRERFRVGLHQVTADVARLGAAISQVRATQADITVRLDRVATELGLIRQALGQTTDAITAYGDDRETIGKLAYFREQLDSYTQRMDAQRESQQHGHLRSV